MEANMAEFDGGSAIMHSAVVGNAEDVDLRLEELYDRFGTALYRYALSITSSPEDAEDAVQDVFVRIARKPVVLRKPERLKAYIFTAARNAAYSILRGRRRRDELNREAAYEYADHRTA